MADRLTRVGDQLELQLDYGPWGGRSPRALTRSVPDRKLRHGPGEPDRIQRRQKDAPTEGRDLQLWLFDERTS